MTSVEPTSFCGLPWEAWTNSLGRSVPLEDEPPAQTTKEKYTYGITKLAKKDGGIFGVCPETEVFSVVVCETCKMCIKQQALVEHYERRHSNQDTEPSLLPLTEIPAVSEKTTKKSVKTPSAKEKRKKTLVKENSCKEKETLPALVPKTQLLTLEGASSPPLKVNTPTLAAAAVSVASRVRTVPVKQREYNPDRHCGVVDLDTMKPCTWSLTCKSHAVSLRRAVTGRSKPFNQLLSDQRRAKEVLNKQKKKLEFTSASPASASSPSPQPLTSRTSPQSKHSHGLNTTPSLTGSVSENKLSSLTSSPAVTAPPAVAGVEQKDVSWNRNLVLRCRLPEVKLSVTPAKRIYLSSRPANLSLESSPLPVYVSPTYQTEPPRALSVATPLFSRRKTGGLLYSDRGMLRARQRVETSLYRATNNFSLLSTCPRF